MSAQTIDQSDGPSAGRGAAGAVNAEVMIAEARKAFFVMFGFLAVVWLLQVLNWASHYSISRDYGVIPHNTSTLGHVFSAPFLHFGWEHIEGNSGPLFIFGFLAAYRGVVKFLGLSVLLIVTSGMAIWFFQDSKSLSVGASGLVFGYFGYVVVRGLFDRHLIDSLIGLVMFASFLYLLVGATPGAGHGVSWLGHMGGLVGGVIGAWLFRERRPRAVKAAGGGSGGGGEREALPRRQPNAGPNPGKAVEKKAPAGPRSDLMKELDDLGLL